MVSKENQLMAELKKKVSELGEHQEKWKKKHLEAKSERDQLKLALEKTKQDNASLRELL